MKGAKFVVLSLRDIIKNLVFILVGIALLVVLFFVFFPQSENTREEENLHYTPGTYSSEVLLKGTPLEVYVTIDTSGIADINTTSLDELQLTYYPLIETAFNNIKPQVLESQSTEIELSVDTYYTEFVLLQAIEDAVEQASN